MQVVLHEQNTTIYHAVLGIQAEFTNRPKLINLNRTFFEFRIPNVSRDVYITS
jgi:hypothetical protein